MIILKLEMKKIFLICLFIILYNLAFSLPTGAEFFYYPLTPLKGEGENFFFNPASAGLNNFFSFFATYGIINDFPYFQGGINIPIFDLKLSFATKISGNNNSEIYREAGSFYSGIIGISKKVAGNFFIGANFNFSYLQKQNFEDIAYSFDTGLIYKIMDLYENENGLCFKNTYFDFIIYGIGKQAVYEDRSGIPPLGSKIGTKTTLLDTKVLDFEIGFDLNYNFLLQEYFFGSILCMGIFDNFGLFGKFTIGNKNIGNFQNGFYPWSFGAFFNRKIGEIPVSLSYSLIPFNFNQTIEFSHFIGLEIALPQHTETFIKLGMGNEKTNYYSFSPNFDREKDVVPFHISVKTDKLIEHWELTILDTNGKVVRKFRDKPEEEYNIIKLFGKIFEKKESIPVPEIIEWDGLADNGSILKEGDYFAYFCLISHRNTNLSETNYIKLDVTPPSGSISLDDIYFSPNGDSFKDSLIMYPSLSQDKWTMKIINKNGEVIYSSNLVWEVATNIMWDGKDKNGKPLPDGLYDAIFLGEDEANNKNILYINDIFLSTQKYAAYLTLRKSISFSLSSFINIKPFIIPANMKLSSWKLSIYKTPADQIKTINGVELPQDIKWDGKDKSGNLVLDGEYFFRLDVVFENGEKASSPVYKLYVDSTPPSVKYNIENIPFSPDNDGENDILKINLDLEDRSGVDNFRLILIDPDRRTFKTFNFLNTNKALIQWNGRSEEGEPVESADNYELFIEAIDKIGNHTKKKLADIPTDILVEKIDRGYKIRINNIEFKFDKYEILPKSIPILKRLAEILKKFRGYEIEIHGHTDNIGDANYNLILSKKRAESVYNYLIKEGISPKQMKTIGFGFKYSIADNSTEEGRRKNRRVEFILKK